MKENHLNNFIDASKVYSEVKLKCKHEITEILHIYPCGQEARRVNNFFKMINLFTIFASEDGKQLLSHLYVEIFQFYAEKCLEDAEVGELCGSAPPHPVRCPVYFLFEFSLNFCANFSVILLEQRALFLQFSYGMKVHDEKVEEDKTILHTSCLIHPSCNERKTRDHNILLQRGFKRLHELRSFCFDQSYDAF